MTKSGRKVIILIAEDDDEDYFLTEKAFQKSKIVNTIVRVKNGVELLDYLQNKNEFNDKNIYPHPTLILLDLNMPLMDGRTALSEIKKNPDLNHIPVAILTTSKEEEDIVSSYKIGACSFLRKPVKFDNFVNVLLDFQKYWFEIVELP
jgi:two-component system response regulator